ncbi:MAG TPA: NYN domain-containing protein [Candidatus Limnocylindrales bacterium]|nr:NYN domain-containing protein [Candidatus Limnocylindrales bacterium]
MTRISHHNDPLAGVTRLLVDGTNLLHAVSRGPDRQPPAALIGRLRGVIPAETAIELVFDGPPERGVRGERIAHGLSVRFSGRHTADTILVTLVEDVAMAAGAAAGGGSPATDAILVVTDDRDLRFALQRRGARTAGTSWLVKRMERPRLLSPSVGNPRPPRPPSSGQGPPSSVRSPAGRAPGDTTEPGEREPWAPGRGATRKRGNAKRTPKR